MFPSIKRPVPAHSPVRFAVLLSLSLIAFTAAPTSRLSAQAPAPAPSDAAAYTLKSTTTKVGDVRSYRMTLKGIAGDGSDQDFNLELRFKESVKTIQPDGSVLIDVDFIKAAAEGGGNEIDLTSRLSKQTLTLDKKGLPKPPEKENDADVGDGIGQVVSLIHILEASVRPDHAVKVGDAWKVDFPVLSQTDRIASGKATLTGKEIMNGADTLKVAVALDPAVDPKTKKPAAIGKLEGVCNYDPATGRLAFFKLKGLENGFGGNGAVTIEMKLLPPPAKNDKAATTPK